VYRWLSTLAKAQKDSTLARESGIQSHWPPSAFSSTGSPLPMNGGNGSGKEVSVLADKVKCVPKRESKKPGPKNVSVPQHKRSSPKPINKKCGS
jgi:hypothetical protein